MFDKLAAEIEQSFEAAKKEIAKKLREAGDNKAEWLMVGFNIGVLVSETGKAKGLPDLVSRAISRKMLRESAEIVLVEQRERELAAEVARKEKDGGYYGPG